MRLRRALGAATVSIVLIGHREVSSSERAALPYDVSVRVDEGGEASRSLREDLLERSVLALRRGGCFRSVAADGADADSSLVLALRVSEIKNEQRYGASIADRANPRDPSVRADVVARFGMSIEATLRGRGIDASIRAYRFRSEREYRPLLESEDAQARAYEQAVEGAAREVSGRLCSGSRRKLAESIEKVLRSPR